MCSFSVGKKGIYEVMGITYSHVPTKNQQDKGFRALPRAGRGHGAGKTNREHNRDF